MRTHITKNEKSVTLKTEEITRGKPQPKTPLSVLSYIGFIQSLRSYIASQLSVQSSQMKVEIYQDYTKP